MKAIRQNEATRIAEALERLQNNISGDVKKLTNFIPAYRLRVGNYRILFEIKDERQIVIYRITHRREAYR